MSLNTLSSTEIRAIPFLDTTKSNTHLLKFQGGVSCKRNDSKVKGFKCSAGTTVPSAWPGTTVVQPGAKNWDGPKPISIIGSTSSIGTQTLDIVAENPDKFKVVALVAGSNVTLLAERVIT